MFMYIFTWSMWSVNFSPLLNSTGSPNLLITSTLPTRIKGPKSFSTFTSLRREKDSKYSCALLPRSASCEEGGGKYWQWVSVVTQMRSFIW
uniref:Uncharacterized protein n=1 Tax=Los Azufres archaeal virus 2 TaxID=1425359 RepID=A0A0A0PA18_9VIRU|nr:hypothetical protein [Los Azufres archaeal virus 2]